MTNDNRKNQMVSVDRMNSACVHAACFMDGMSEGAEKMSDWRGRTNTGMIEMMSELATHAATLSEMEWKAANIVDDIYPGIFAYEVSKPFGKWFALQCIEQGSMPKSEEIRKFMSNRVYRFFCQDLVAGSRVDERIRAKLSDTLGVEASRPSVKLFIEAYSASHDASDAIVPAYVSVTADDRMIAELNRLLALVKNNGLDMASVGVNALVEWGSGETNSTSCNEMVVSSDGTFWFTGFPMPFDGDYSVESRAIQIGELWSAINGNLSDGFCLSSGALYFSTGVSHQDLIMASDTGDAYSPPSI